MKNETKIKHMIVDLEELREPYGYNSQLNQDIKEIISLLEKLKFNLPQED